MTFRLVIASTNPVKRRAAEQAVRSWLGEQPLDVRTVDAPSGVPDQPFGDDQTLAGARNRVVAARALEPAADLWIGLEGGLVERNGGLESMAWVVVHGAAAKGGAGKGEARHGEARSATFALPREVETLVRAGVELGEATDRIFAAHDSKQTTGIVGPLTGGDIDRVTYYAHAVALALVPFRNKRLTFAGPGASTGWGTTLWGAHRPWAIAHRGASGDAPENTFAAFSTAIGQGADAIETDVRLCADGVPVIFHDKELTRTTDAATRFPGRDSYRVDAFTLAELKQLDAGSWNADAFAGEPIPTLRELLARIGGRTGLLLELKGTGPARGAASGPASDPGAGLEEAVATEIDRHLAEHPDTARTLVVASINRDLARSYKRLRPATTVGALIVDPDTPDEELADLARSCDVLGTGRAVVSRTQLDRIHGFGMLALTNTSTAHEMRTMRDRGIDGTVSDYPGRMREVRERQDGFFVEAEALLPATRASVPLTARPNAGMNGCRWSNNREASFEATGPGAAFTLTLPAFAAGRYALELVLTKGPEGGTHQAYLDGVPLGDPYDGYRPSTVRETVAYGTVSLAAGSAHELTVRVLGAHPDSAGYRVGIDVIVLRPVDGPS